MYAPTVGPRVGPWESASQWWRIITMIRAAFHGAPVLRERDSRNSRDPRQKEVQKAPQRKKTCNQRVKKQNFHDRCYGSLLPCLVFCVHGIWNNVHSLFLFHLSHFLIRFLFFFFFNEKYQWIIHLNYNYSLSFCSQWKNRYNFYRNKNWKGEMISNVYFKAFGSQEIFETFLKCD